MAGDSNLSETATQLLFDFSAPAFHFNHFCLGSEATCPGGWAFISFGGGSGVHRVQTNAGLVVGSNLFGLGVIGQLAPVPVPASLWLLGSALSGLGFTRRRGAK